MFMGVAVGTAVGARAAGSRAWIAMPIEEPMQANANIAAMMPKSSVLSGLSVQRPCLAEYLMGKRSVGALGIARGEEEINVDT